MEANSYLAVLQAGGRGTRLRELTGDQLPKPLLPLGGRPMLEWQVLNLRQQGITEFVIIIGHLGGMIRDYFGDGSRLGVSISYIEEREPLGSGGALAYLREMVSGFRHILVTLGDVMFDIDLPRFVAFHESAGAAATLLVHPNAHPQDSDLIVLDEVTAETSGPVLGSIGGRVLRFDDKASVRDYYYENCVNAGLYLLEPEVLLDMGEARHLDLEREVLLPYLSQGRLFGYRSTEYVKDAGTPERFRAVERELAAGIWRTKNLSVSLQRAIFFDRDGTLNVYRGLISEPEQLDLLPGVAEAVRLVNSSGRLALLASNQPVVARGLCSVEEVRQIHRRLGVLLGCEGAYLDDMAFCPHHPDRGFPEENPVYKISCHCRKPDTGMIEALAVRWHLDLAGSWLIGDSVRDIECGRRAGLKTALVLTGEDDGRRLPFSPDLTAKNVLEAVKKILEDGL